MRIVKRLSRKIRHRLHPPTKEQAAAMFFVNNYAKFSSDEMTKLVHEYWTQYRCLDEILEKTSLSLNRPEMNLLDIGGGYSTVLRLFEKPNRWVLDICVGELIKSGLNLDNHIHWICGPGERIPFPDQFFDVVFCSNALDHVDDPDKVIAETHRVLKSNGFWILIVDIFDEGAGQQPRDVRHPHNLHEEKLNSMLKQHFLIEYQTTPLAKGKVGLWMLAAGNIILHTDRQEFVYCLKPL